MGNLIKTLGNKPEQEGQKSSVPPLPPRPKPSVTPVEMPTHQQHHTVPLLCSHTAAVLYLPVLGGPESVMGQKWSVMAVFIWTSPPSPPPQEAETEAGSHPHMPHLRRLHLHSSSYSHSPGKSQSLDFNDLQQRRRRVCMTLSITESDGDLIALLMISELGRHDSVNSVT